jgi:hypothetical protein
LKKIAVKFDQGEDSDEEAAAELLKAGGKKPKQELDMPSSESESESYSEDEAAPKEGKMVEEKPEPVKKAQYTSKYKPVLPPADSESEDSKPDELEDVIFCFLKNRSKRSVIEKMSVRMSLQFTRKFSL